MPAPDGPRRLLLIAPRLGRGGMARYLVELATHLAGDGFTLSVLTSDLASLDHWRPALDAAGVSCTGTARLGRRSVRGAIEEIGAQAVKLFTGAFPPNTRLASRLLGVRVPLVESLHAWPRRDRVRLGQRAFLRLRPGRRYRLVVFSRWMEDRVADRLPSLRPCLRRIPMGMALPEAGLEDRTHGNPRFVSVGRLDEVHKDFTTLLHAFEHTRARIPQATLTIVGDGPSREQLRRLAADLEIDGSVTFAGWSDDPVAALRRGDVFVHATKNESFGRVAVEAAAVGLPVIASDVGGVRDAVDEGGNGVLVPPGDADALAEAMVALAEDAGRRAALGAAGPAHASHFDMGAHVRALMEVVREATG